MKYIDVYEKIKKKIMNGSYQPWTSIEGETMLSRMHDVSRPTIRKALDKLKNEGYIHTRQGSGIFVNPPEFYEEKNLKTLSERIEDREKIENIVLEFEITDGNNKLLDIFNFDSEREFYHYKRLRKVDGKPNVLEETYMPVYLFEDFDKTKLQNSVIEYIEKECDYTISHDVKNIKAITIDESLSKCLELEEGTATLEIDHKVYLIKSVLAQYTREVQIKNDIKFVSVR